MYVFQYLCGYMYISKYISPIYQLLTTGVNSSFSACGHVGCWVEFHPASLSEGWLGDLTPHSPRPDQFLYAHEIRSYNGVWCLSSLRPSICPQCSKLLPVRLPEADNFWGGPGTFLKICFNFMFMIWDSRQEDWQLFWLSFEHCTPSVR